jgi:hypothetical protein
MLDAQVATVNDVLGQAIMIKAPSKISVRSEGKFDRVVDVEFGEDSPEVSVNNTGGVADISSLMTNFKPKPPPVIDDLDDDEIPF